MTVFVATPLNSPQPFLNAQGAIVHPGATAGLATWMSFTDRISVMEFGAAGSNTTSDNAIFAAANTLLTGTSVALYIPSGTYIVDTTAVAFTCQVILGPNVVFSLQNSGTITGFTRPNFARAVVTTLQAYTGTGTGTLTQTTAAAGLSAADGVTVAVGDVLFIQAGTTNLTGALDAGPWQVVTLGTASVKWVLTRPSWYANGAVIPAGMVIDIGGEGTNYLGAQFKSFANANSSNIIGTNDPAFFVREFVSAVTLTTGFVKLGPSQTFPGLKSVTTSDITFTPTNFSGASTTVSYRTGVYASGGSATAAGAMGTSTVSITALVAAGTFNTNDVGTGLLTIRNW